MVSHELPFFKGGLLTLGVFFETRGFPMNFQTESLPEIQSNAPGIHEAVRRKLYFANVSFPRRIPRKKKKKTRKTGGCFV